MKRFAALGIMALIAACDGPAELAIAPPIGAGGASAQSSSSASASASSSSGVPICLDGGASCEAFSECCSGTCANNVCAACGKQGDSCGGGCCVGLICYNSECNSCGPDGAPCLASGDCCSGVCSNGTCADLVCKPSENECGTKCVDKLDHDNCLSCGVACAAANSCCQQGCRDLMSDVMNCGACNNVCPEVTHTCDNGACKQRPECCKWVTNNGVGYVDPPQFVANTPGLYAWRVTPLCDVHVQRIDILTGTIGMGIGTAPDANGYPGPITFLDNAQVLPVPDGKWVGAAPLSPLMLHAGMPIWLMHGANVGKPLSTSLGGAGFNVMLRVTGQQQWQPWTPGMQQPMIARVIGDCAP